ncbi:MAG: UTP--glucose-1-phosphate uridylyltransferase [Candidatus Helarchaeota archaeon]
MIRKAVIPAAGLGTRLLPATYAQPKEMLPCGRKPTIQYVVEELAAAGVKDVLIITGRAKRALEDHFDQDFALLERLKNSGKTSLLEDTRFIEKLDINIFFTRQAEPTGLADALYLAKDFMGNEPFFVALGDTIIQSDPIGKFLVRLGELYSRKSCSGVIGLEKVKKKEEVRKYGIINGVKDETKAWKILDLIEKPSPEEAPSQVAICGRYLFDSSIFTAIERTKVGFGGEKQLTDSIKILIEEDKEFWGVELSEKEKRYDIGSAFTYTIAFIELSLLDPSIVDLLKPYLKELVSKL